MAPTRSVTTECRVAGHLERARVPAVQHDEDGCWCLHGRLDADHGAILDAALSEARPIVP